MNKAFEVNEVLVESISLCKKNKASFITPIITFLFTLIPFLLGIWAYASLFQTKSSLIAITVLVLIITMYLRSFFSVMQSFVIANTVWEEKSNFSEALKRAFLMSGSVSIYSLVSLLVGLVSLGTKRHKKVFLSDFIKKPFEGVSEDLWGVTTNLALPSMAITKNKFAESLLEVKKGMAYVPEIKIKDLGIEYFTYPMVFFSLVLSLIIGYLYYVSLGVLVFVSIILVLFLVQSYIKTTYFTVLYIWMGEQIQRKKKKQKLETRVPAILENSISVKII